MSPVLLAIDAGGTTTRCAAVTEDARCLGFARHGAGNPISAGAPVAVASLASAAADALRMAEASPEEVGTVTVAMAGISSGAAFEQALQSALESFGVRAALRFDSDAMASFCSGTASENGSVLISGTGAAAVRMHGGRAVATADGLGWLLGDVGSGFWIGHQVARAALAHLDRRGPQTVLSELLIAGTDSSAANAPRTDDGRPAEVVRILASTYAARPVELARLAPLVFAAANEGDPVARAIIDEAAEGLHATLRAVRVPGAEPVVAAGGILAHQSALRRRIEERLRADGDSVELIRVDDGLTGAAVLALRGADIPVDEDLRLLLHANIEEHRRAVTG